MSSVSPVARFALAAIAITSGAYAVATTSADTASPRITQAMVDSTISTWKKPPQQTARVMLAKYGLPNEVSANRLLWHDNGPWKMTALVNEEVPHDFPIAVNLAHDVATGKRDVDAARRFYGESIAAMMKGQTNDYLKGMRFEVARAGQGDRDKPLDTLGTSGRR